MKNILFLLSTLILCTAIANCNESVVLGIPYSEYNTSDLDSLDLKGIELKIYNTFVQSIVGKDGSKLKKLGEDLDAMAIQHKNPIINYWQAYFQYYYSIFKMELEDTDGSKNEIEKGIKIMKNIKSKNSEDYALLAMLQSFSIQFKKGMIAGMVNGKVKKNIEKAIALDDTNLRAYFVAASSDFYTPEQYGGGEKAESYLLKAVELPNQKIKNDYLPAWGKETTFEMLIQVYLKKGDLDNARKYFHEGLEVYPDSYVIKSLATELVVK